MSSFSSLLLSSVQRTTTWHEAFTFLSHNWVLPFRTQVRIYHRPSNICSLNGYGIVTGWQAGFFNSEFCESSHGHWYNVQVDHTENINYLELVPIWLALVRFAKSWENSSVLRLTDNIQVVAALKVGQSQNKSSMVLLRKIFWICAKYNIYITSRHFCSSNKVSVTYIQPLTCTNKTWDKFQET